MTAVLLMLTISVASASAANQPTQNPTTSAPTRARPGPPNVKVPSDTHKTLDPKLHWTDHNVYPADNAVVLQGAASGPIGDQQNAQFWLTGVHAHDIDNGPSHLEAVMIYAVDCDDCPGEETSTVKIGSMRATPTKPARLLGVDEMTVEDIDKDGKFEVTCTARFMPCCEDTEDRQPYSEQIILTVTGSEIVRLPQPR